MGENLFKLEIGLSVLAIIFTLITEHPRSNLNPEREALNQVRDIYLQTDLSEKKLLASHPYFLKSIDWPADLWNSNLITPENLSDAPTSTVVIWDGHYSQASKGGINNTEIPRLGYVELFRVVASDNSYSVIVYEKREASAGSNPVNRLAELIDSAPNAASLYFGLGRYHTIQKDYFLAKKNFEQAIALDSSQFIFHLMLGDLAYFNMELEKALSYYLKAIQLCPNQFIGHAAAGDIYYKLKQYQMAIHAYSGSLNIQKNNPAIHLKRGLAHSKLGQLDAACQDWDKGRILGNTQSKNLFEQSCGN